MEVKASDYPSAGMLPKGLTQVDEFLSKNPTFDGRDTVVAILDTGIDPAAIGMQTTSTGKPKVVDFIDCTGIGDVQMEPAQKCSDKNPLELVGASGRTLKLNPNWKNPSGDWYVGSKSLYSIAPAEVTGELGKERRMLHTEKHEAMQLSIAKHQQQHGDGDYSSAKIEALDNLKRLYQDCGPLLDCVVFHDGNQWLAAIDTEESGDFAEIPAMGAYKSTGDVGMLCKRHLLYYTVNFYDNGKILSIVTPPHIHSTHVSGIAAAFDPEEPVYMGIAPGAQILSLSVGDKRTGMMETGIGLIRAVNAIIEYNVDVANMSYGEPSSTSNEGQWINLIKSKVINQHQCTFVSSAGNLGPAISTVAAPGGTTDDIIGVGAYFTKEQMITNHSMLNPTEDSVFKFSSCGPASNGSRGVDIFAPGCAISSYPLFAKARLQHHSGTSMASPYVCGAIALLISAWKQTYGPSSKSISPYRIKNAILSTAKDFGFELGAGLIQVSDAWEFLKKYADRTYEDVKLNVFNVDLNNMTGIYLREACDMRVPRYFKLKVVPEFHKSPRADNKDANMIISNYEQRIILKATVPWVQVANSVYVNSLGKQFEVCVDATSLEAGLLHTGAILGYDSCNIERGPVFDYPVTVTKPLNVDSSAIISFDKLELKPHGIIRRFINVPLGATTAEIAITSNHRINDATPAGIIQFKILQLLPETRFNKHQSSFIYRLGASTYVAGDNVSKEQNPKTFKVVGNRTLEICATTDHIAQGLYNFNIQIGFSGISPVAATTGNNSDASIVLNGNKYIERIDLISLVCHQYKFKPQLSLDILCKSLRPSKANITNLFSERDVHPATDRAAHQLTLNYKFTTCANNRVVQLKMPGLSDIIYESWADEFRLAVFDANRKCVGINICYSKHIILRKEGEYLVQVQIRHQNKHDLEPLKDMCLLLEYNIENITLPTVNYALDRAFTNTAGGIVIPKAYYLGNIVPLHVKTRIDNLPKMACPGDILLGKLRITDEEISYPIQYIVPTMIDKKSKYDSSSNISNSANKEETTDNAMELSIRYLRINQINQIKTTTNIEMRENVVATLTASAETEEDRIAVLMTYLNSVDTYNRSAFPWSSDCGITTENATKVIEIADQIVERTQTAALISALYAAHNNNDATDKEKQEKRIADSAKKQLIAALKSKCYSAAYLAANKIFSDDKDNEDNADAILKYKKSLGQLLPWEDYRGSSIQSMVLSVTLLMLEKKYADALNKVIGYVAKTPLLVSNSKERLFMYDLRDKILQKLGWTLWSDYYKASAKFTVFDDYEQF